MRFFALVKSLCPDLTVRFTVYIQVNLTASHPHLTRNPGPAQVHLPDPNLAHTQPGVCKIKRKQKPAPGKILKSEMKNLTFGVR